MNAAPSIQPAGAPPSGNAALPDAAEVVIVGGGIVGASLAYHLAQLGRDVLLLEQNSLGGGTTWHAAGLVGQLRTSNSMTKINRYSVELYPRLHTETGVDTGWTTTGSLILATSADRMVQLRRTVAMAGLFGVQAHILSPREAAEKWPLIRSADVLGAAWLPDDGKCRPKETTLALACGARLHGAKILEGIRVEEILVHRGRATGVRTSRGPVQAAQVVLCGGMWTRSLGLKAGVDLPLFPVEHHYIVSAPVEGAFDALPVGRDPDRCIYFRGEGDRIVLGAFQKYTKPWDVPEVPASFSFQLLDADWEKFADPLQAGRHRIPALENSRFESFVNGPESFTPDNNFLMGETPGVRSLFVLAGFNSVGIASAGGAGKFLAEWMTGGAPALDLWPVDVRRFGPALNNRSFLRERATEVLGLHYQMAWPHREPATGRNLRRSPLHAALAAAGACFGQKAGWERPNWFAAPGQNPVPDYSWNRGNWFAAAAAEHLAARSRVAVFDQSGFAKIECQGPDALRLLQRACGNNIDVPPGRAIYTGLFNASGGFESDLTVLRLAGDRFRLVTGTAQAVRDMDWLRRQARPRDRATLTDVTESWSVIGVMGPSARTLLARLTPSPDDLDHFPFGHARRLELAQSVVLAVRITYVGELGWELHVPPSQALQLHEALLQAGADLGVARAGHYAINSLRLEKAYRAWGADLSPEDTPLEAGLAFALAWDKPGGFTGRSALLRQKKSGPRRRLACLVLDDPGPLLWGGEPILRDGIPVGHTTSGSYGHTLGAAVGLGYLRNPAGPASRDWVTAGSYAVVIDGNPVPATAHLQAPYDPARTRILA